MTDAVKSGILAAYPFARLAVVGAFEASFRNENWLVEDERRRREQVLEAAQRLAQFHIIAETFPDEAVALDYQPPIRDWWVSAEENLQALEGMFAGVAVQEELAYLREWWRWVLAEWPLGRLDALPVGWVYGDYHGRNMVFVGDKLRGVHMFGREARDSLRIRPEVARLFIEAYARALSREERPALPVMVAMHFPPDARYYCYCQRQRGEYIEARLRREVGIMRGLRAEMARIGPMLSHV